MSGGYVPWEGWSHVESRYVAAGWVTHNVHVPGLLEVSEDACYRALGWLLQVEDALAGNVYDSVPTCSTLRPTGAAAIPPGRPRVWSYPAAGTPAWATSIGEAAATGGRPAAWRVGAGSARHRWTPGHRNPGTTGPG